MWTAGNACLDDSLASYDMKENNQFKTIVVFDCRGIEPVEFSPRNGWKVRQNLAFVYLKIKKHCFIPLVIV